MWKLSSLDASFQNEISKDKLVTYYFKDFYLNYNWEYRHSSYSFLQTNIPKLNIAKSQIRASLNDCWSFWKTKIKQEKELYTLLDDGTDFNGIFIYMQLDEDGN